MQLALKLPAARAEIARSRHYHVQFQEQADERMDGDEMRNKLTILAIFVALPISAFPARRLTVEQLQQMVAADELTHRNDDQSAQQLQDVKLISRLSSPALNQILASSPGSKTAQALHALADDSAFLDPPPGEILPVPAPGIATQKAIMAQVIHYVAKTLPQLPDFFATRVTEHYYDEPFAAVSGSIPIAAGLHTSGIAQTPIAYRNGQEIDEPSRATDQGQEKKSRERATEPKSPAATKANAASKGLSSWGEFGPILGVILVDAAKSKLTWQRWEQQGGKRVAVFQFAVDRSVSHYTVQYCCVASGDELVSGSYGGATGREAHSSQVKTGSSTALHQIVGYHGHLSVDPDSGAVLNIAIEADLQPDDPIQRAAMMVEYGPVQMGGKTFFCPTRSVSISQSREQFQASPTSAIQSANRLLLNDVQFTGYHRFGSEVTMVDEAAEKPALTQTEAVNSPSPSTGTSADAAAIAAPNSPPNSATSTVATAPTPAPAKPQPTAAESEADQEFLIHEVDSLPGTETAADNASNPTTNIANNESGNFTLKVTTRLVDVSLVALDKHDKPVTDLKPDDIELYDNGRKQQIRVFHHASPVASESAAQPPAPDAPPDTSPGTFTNTPQTASPEDSSDLLILLMDEAHLPFNDLNQARGEVLRYLKATRPNSRAALYSISEHGFRVIQDVTTDHALLQAKLAAWKPSASAISQAQTLDRRDRQQFDTVHSEQDMNSVNGNYTDSAEGITSIDPELRQMGDNPLRQALSSMIGLARHFATLPGHKSLAWISGDSVLADWEDRQVRTEKGDKQNEVALLHAKEVLNEAHIALYAVDASPATANGGGAVSAELGNATVQLDPTATANSRPGGAGGPHGAAIGAGRATADLQQNSRAIQGPIRQLAEGTGGMAINRGGDLKATLDAIEAHTAALYEIGFDPDTPADNKFHTLTLKVPHRKDLKLRYRTGYLYNEEAVSTKQRFQQAIWSPQDATGIRLSAETIPASETPSGKSTVRLRVTLAGLELQQKADRWTDQLYIYIAQRDDAKQKASVSGETMRISMKQATYEAGMPAGIPYQRAVEPQSKLGSIRVIVVDANSGNIGSVTLPSTALHP